MPSIRAKHVPADPVFPAVSAPAGGQGAAFLGVLMLQTRFPRPPGDIGHPASFGVPVRQLVIEGARAGTVVQDAAGLRASGLLQAFAAGARGLQSEGAAAITTSCGFLVLFQRELQDAVAVPLVTSSLALLPELLSSQAQVGVLTISAPRLGAEHLAAAGVPARRVPDVVIEGMPADGEFAGAILGDRPEMDVERARAEVVAAALRLQQRAPQLRTLVLECTNLPPHAAAIEGGNRLAHRVAAPVRGAAPALCGVLDGVRGARAIARCGVPPVPLPSAPCAQDGSHRRAPSRRGTR